MRIPAFSSGEIGISAVKMKFWRSIGTAVLDVVYPRGCLLCGAAVDGESAFFCTGCERKLRYERAQPVCPRCGHGVGPFGVREGYCFMCRRGKPHLDRLARVGPYRGATGKLVRVFKYAHRDELGGHLGTLLAEAIDLTDWAASADALVYVPTHWRHSIGRAYYAPKVLARSVARFTGLPQAPVLRRVAAGPSQLAVPRSQRARNIRGQFGVIPGARVRGARLCLLDDVSTTGATLNECARVLKKAGAAAVYGAVLAKVDTATHWVDGV